MKKDVLKKLIAKPNEKHKVSDFDTKYTAKLSKNESEELLNENILLLRELQNKLYAHDKYSILIIFQAMDAAGKDGTIKHVMSGINPQGCQVFSFKQPSAEELDHDYLWRIYKSLPERGRIGIFNRSHYEDVLVAKVHPGIVLNGKIPGINKPEDIDDKFWKKRYRQINDFERHLSENGTVIIKFFLNISEKEQEKRFLARLNDEAKNWKFSVSDLKERAFWDDYMRVYSDILTHTSTDDAPWYVIPADNKWFMRYAVSEIICERIKSLDISYPKLSETAKKEIEAAKKALGDSIEKKDTKDTEQDTAKDKAKKNKKAPKSSSKGKEKPADNS